MSHSQHHVSPQQLAANRANAAKSSGPRSPEGKHRSSQNARKHGFTATTFAVVRLEDLQEVAHLRDDLIDFYHPLNSQELFALERVALAQQAILRGARLEAGLFTNCLNESCVTNGDCDLPMNSQAPGEIEITKAQNRNFILADGFHRLNRQGNSFALLLRYQAQAERQYRRAIEEFDRLKALREELPNQASSAATEAQPEQTESLIQTNQTNPSALEHPAPEPLLPTAPGPPVTAPVTEPELWSLPDPRGCVGPPPPAPDTRSPAPDGTSR